MAQAHQGAQQAPVPLILYKVRPTLLREKNWFGRKIQQSFWENAKINDFHSIPTFKFQYIRTKRLREGTL